MLARDLVPILGDSAKISHLMCQELLAFLYLLLTPSLIFVPHRNFSTQQSPHHISVLLPLSFAKSVQNAVTNQLNNRSEHQASRASSLPDSTLPPQLRFFFLFVRASSNPGLSQSWRP